MLHGDLSSEVLPTVLFAWEHLLAQVPEQLQDRERRAAQRGKWERVLWCWEPNERMRRVLNDLAWRKNRQIQVVTFYPEKYAMILAERLEDENYPCADVVCGYPRGEFGRALVHMPWLVAVYHAEPHPFLFGHWGVRVDPLTYSGNDL